MEEHLPSAETEIEVVDARKLRFGVIMVDHVDRDSFRKLKRNSRLVYFYLLPWVGRSTRQAWPKVKTLMKVSGLSRATIFRALAELKRERWIEIDKKRLSPARRINRYTILDPP